MRQGQFSATSDLERALFQSLTINLEPSAIVYPPQCAPESFAGHDPILLMRKTQLRAEFSLVLAKKFPQNSKIHHFQ